MRVFRLVKERYKDQVLAGMGASFYEGARWNEPGQRAVYASENRALAVVESLAYVPRLRGLPQHVMCEIEVDDVAIQAPGDAPSPNDAAAARAYGAQWFREMRSVALAVPSIIVPEEKNIVLNAGHPDFNGRVRVASLAPYPLDDRLASLLGKS